MRFVCFVLIFCLVAAQGFEFSTFSRRNVNLRQTTCDVPNFVDNFECLEPGASCPVNNDCEDPTSEVCSYCKFSFDPCTPGSICPTTYIGQDCNDDEDCAGDLSPVPARCVGDVCVAFPDYKQDGDYCTNSSECYGTTTCDSGICSGLSIGSPCTNDLECVVGAICPATTSNCTAKVAVGEPCGPADKCVIGAECNEGVCIDSFSLSSGSACSEPGVCGEDLVCINAAATCETYVAGGNACNKSVSPDPCYAANPGSFCQCDFSTGDFKCTANSIWKDIYDCKSELESAVECATENNCGIKGGAFYWEGTCMTEICGDEIKSYFKCFFGSLSSTGYQEEIFNCGTNRASTDSSSSQATSAASRLHIFS